MNLKKIHRNRISRAALIGCVAMSLMLGTTSCIGKFALTNKLLAWNKTVGSKFVNELVFFAFWVLPVYEVSGLADLLVLNSIEFWSGTNPVAQGPKMIKGEHDNYLVECDGKGYTITAMHDGSMTRLDFDSDERTWSVTAGGETYELLTFVDDSHVALPGAGGTRVVVSLDEAGLMAYEAQAATYGSNYRTLNL